MNMTDLITQLWVALRDAGLPEVMLYLPDGTACRCHWNDTALIGTTRVALLADQDRKIVTDHADRRMQGHRHREPQGHRPHGLSRP